MKHKETTYLAFLRGINVGGHHKVPMADLKREMKRMGFKNIITILNSGNIIFDAITDNGDADNLEKMISDHLEQVFGFSIPVLLRPASTINRLLSADPFKNEELTKEKRFYVSFLRSNSQMDLQYPWSSDDGSVHILAKIDQTVISVLDLAIANTPKAMGHVERIFGKDITTRNWNTIQRVGNKLPSAS